MGRFKGIYWAAALLICIFSLTTPTGFGQACNNETVVQATKMGLQPSMIVKAIKGQKCSFDTNLQALANLKMAGVSDEVISVMQDMTAVAGATPPAPAPVPQPNGQPEVAGMAPQDVAIFSADGKSQTLTRFDRNALDSGKLVKKSVTMGVTLGVKGVFMADKDRVIVPGASSDIHVNSAEGIYLVANGFMLNPDSVFLFKAESKNDARVICQTKGRMGSVDQLIGEKVSVKVSRGSSGQAYRIEPLKALARGEYGLVMDRFAQFIWTFGIQ